MGNFFFFTGGRIVLYDRGHKGVSWCVDEKSHEKYKEEFKKERGRIERYFSKVKRKFPRFLMGETVDIDDENSITRFNNMWLAANIFVALNWLAKQDVQIRMGNPLRGDMCTLFDPKRHTDPNLTI